VSTSDAPPGDSNEPNELVGSLFAGRFRVVRVVSEGANSTIYDATDGQTGRTVTLKLIAPDLAASPTFRTRFDDVMRAAATLTHPNIAAVYDWGMARLDDTSTAYVVIEQLTGGSLRDLFDRGRRLSPSQALAVGLDACRGLDHAHRRGLVHGELTPSKLVFGDDRRLRIVDFGLARLLGEPAWERPDSVPTHVAWYASPEQGEMQPIDGTTDVYALCLALHEAVTGVLPFRDDSTVASLSARVGRLMPVSADLGPLASVLERAGRPEAHDRSTAAEFGKGLVQAAAKLPRPEPLPLLSTGLFDTPADQLRTPDDPTGGVDRPIEVSTDGIAADLIPEASAPEAPAPDVVVVPVDEPAPLADPTVEGAIGPAASSGDDAVPSEVPAPPLIIEAEPDAEIPLIDPGDDLVILPLDSDITPEVEVLAAVDGDPAGDEHPAEPTPAAVPTLAPSGAAAAETQVIPAAVAEPLPRRRRGFPWKMVVAVLVVAALAVLGVLATRLFETPVYTVPDLIEVPEAEARNQIATNAWVLTIERERSDIVPVVGQVVRTAPQAGVELAEGEPFLMVVSNGPTLRELPDSTGVVAGEAQTRLVERGLAVESIDEYHELIPAGTVISWSVPADPTLVTGSLVEPETMVLLVVSDGPAPRVVPDVVGETAGGARDAVEDVQLEFVEGAQEFSDEVPLGTVISQDIEAGTEVTRGSPVTVIVSKGPDLVAFPDISDAATYEEADAILRAAGFVTRLTFGDAQGAIREYTIDGDVPDVGETFRRGTQVDFEAL
jgi:serine/threonine-protein kinase